MSIVLMTASKQRVLVNDHAMASGGEGTVHRILSSASYNNHCVKLYFPQHRNKKREDKINFMANNPPPSLYGSMGGKYVICWPNEAVYENHKFAGFVMPYFDGSVQLYELCTPTLRPQISRAWHTKYDRASTKGVQSRLKLCVNISSAIATIHQMGSYVFVDLKPQNLLVTDEGRVALIDLDSIQIASNNRILFPAHVATAEYVPAEGNHLNPAKDLISESWDRFSLAIVFYEVLFGLHPYAASFKGKYQNYTAIADFIKSGLFVYGSKRSYVYYRPQPHDNFNRVPISLQQLFLNAFDAGSTNASMRPKAEEWGRTIFGELGNPIKPFKSLAAVAKKNTVTPPPFSPTTVVPTVPPAGIRVNPTTNPAVVPQAHNTNIKFSRRGAGIILVVLGLIASAWLIGSVSQPRSGPTTIVGGSAPPRQPVDVSSIRAAVMGALDGWVAATKTGNVENCMSFFADRLDTYYSLRNVGSDKVRSDLMKAFSHYSTFDVQLSNIDITPDQNGTTATATFDKSFNFQGPKYYSAKVQQRMWFANQGGRWRITGLKELQIYSKDTGVVAAGNGGTTDTSTGSQGTTPQPPSYDPNAYRIRQEALAQDYWQRADRLLQQRQYSAALDVCNEGLAAVPGNDALSRKRGEIERALAVAAGNGSGQPGPRQPTLTRRSSSDSQVPIPAPRPTPPVYQGPRQGVITRSIVIEPNELISVGDELPGIPVQIDAVEPRDQVGIVESPGPSNRWRKLVLRSKKKMHVVITIRWSVL